MCDISVYLRRNDLAQLQKITCHDNLKTLKISNDPWRSSEE